MHKWQKFERLAEKIYRELDDRAQITWDDHIYGHDTETSRQIDVSIRWKDQDVDRLTIVQVKDWKKRADVVDVGSFAMVVRDVRADQGVLVCNAGFSKKAKTYARNIGIQLHNLHDAESRDWGRGLTIPILWREQLPGVNFKSSVRFDGGDEIDANAFGFVEVDGVQRDFHSYFVERWNSGELSRALGVVHPFELGGRLTIRVIRPDGNMALRPAPDSQVSYSVTEKTWLGQFEPGVCRGYIDYLNDDALIVSHLPVGEVPSRRGDSWTQISNPDRVAVSIAGSFVTTESFQVAAPDSFSRVAATYLGP